MTKINRGMPAHPDTPPVTTVLNGFRPEIATDMRPTITKKERGECHLIQISFQLPA
jgi:hypothetical protein